MTPSPSPDWNPEQYERFRDERARPFFDLLDLVQPRPGMRVVDLGCGTGELTRELHRRLSARETIGIDNSPAMLAKSAAFAGDGLRFEPGNIGAFASEGAYDLVFSNAALHWIPNHEALLPRLAATLTETSQLAVQVPANDDYPSHTTAVEVAREAPFREALAGHVRQSPVLAPEVYATLLHRLDFREQHVRLQVYAHELESREAVVEWVREACSPTTSAVSRPSSGRASWSGIGSASCPSSTIRDPSSTRSSGCSSGEPGRSD